MAGTAITPLQEAIYAKLTGDPTLVAMVTGIYNDVPDQVLYPYVLMSHAIEKEWNTFGNDILGIGSDVIVRLHIYSRYEGDKPALDILNRIYALLHYKPLVVSGYLTVLGKMQMARVLVEDIDKIQTRHIPSEYRALLAA